MAGHRGGDPGTPPDPTGKASSRAVTDNCSIFRMYHHTLAVDLLEATPHLAFRRFAELCKVSISPIPVHKESAVCGSLEAAPFLGWRRLADLGGL